jgi:hypothetical protein
MCMCLVAADAGRLLADWHAETRRHPDERGERCQFELGGADFFVRRCVLARPQLLGVREHQIVEIYFLGGSGELLGGTGDVDSQLEIVKVAKTVNRVELGGGCRVMNGRALARCCDGRGVEQLHRHAVLALDPAPSDFGPHVVTPTSRDHGELFAWKLRHRRQLELHRPEFVERALGFDRQQLVDDAAHGVESETTCREIDLPGRRHDVRLVADVHDERFAIDAHDRLEK